MKNKAAYILGIVTLVLSMASCNSDNGKADGYGNFEATEITISSENNGKLMQFNVKEGDLLEKGTLIGYIDTIPLSLKREQLISSKAVVSSQSKSVLSQISVLNAKLKTANANKQRAENLIADNAGTQKQLDDINGEIDVI
ncbi:MAG: biotin/lipoyl-binding protein, partial [Eudoraea sp.]|uniref:biotin/lipoyl-binding protein n=1 Tax=Eudoraea sp. TaxID=1979955 RepID=UPI003C77F9C4